LGRGKEKKRKKQKTLSSSINPPLLLLLTSIVMDTAGNLKTSSIELDLDRPNIEDYLPSGSSIQEPRGKLRLYEFCRKSFVSGSVFVATL
jgi:hypothetical protein